MLAQARVGWSVLRMNLKHLLPLALLTASTASAQISANIEGHVTDPAGASIASARVMLTENSTHAQRQTITPPSGDYSFPQLNPGTYTVDVTAPGFEHLTRTGITASVGQTASITLALTLGGDQQTVTVNADAPLLQAAQSDIETHIPGATVVAIPLNSRNFINLATLAPGVSLPPGTVLPRINGGRPRTNEYLYDGISALQPEPGQVAFFPVVDGIQEFTIEADNVPAEFGRFNGGVVNVATRSGSNTFHGSLFEFFRNEDLNARNFFATTGPRPEYRRNLYGATLGGPVVHDHLFFFGDYQGVKALIGRTVISTIPTLNERKGIFTGVSKIYNPATTTTAGGKYLRQEFPNDTITTPFDPAAAALLALFPTPTTSAAANNYTRTANDADHQNQFDFRVDGAFRQHDRAFARYSYFSDVELPVTPLPGGSGAVTGSVIGTGGVVGLSHVLGQQAVFDETHIFTSRLLNDARLGYTRRGNGIAGPTLGNTASAALGIPGIPTNAAFNNALPLFTFTGFQQLGPSASTFSQYQTAVWQFVDTVGYTRGRHALKAGVDVRFYQLNAVSPPNPTGSFAFTTTGTDTQTTAATTTTGGNSIASFLLGQVDTFSIDLQTSKLRPRDHIQEYFLQDDWRATDRLTLNLGARWTLHSPSTEKNNQGAVFNLATQQLDYAGVNGNPTSARTLHYGNIAPRLGFTYRHHAEDRRPLRLRHRLHRPVRHHHAFHPAPVPFHPERPAAHAGQHQRRLRARKRPQRHAHPAYSKCGPWPERLHGQPHRRLRLRRAVEPRLPARGHQRPLRRSRLRRLAHRPRRHPGLEPEPDDRRAARARLIAADAGGQPLLRPDPHLQHPRRQDRGPPRSSSSPTRASRTSPPTATTPAPPTTTRWK